MATEPTREEHLLPGTTTPLQRALSASDQRLLSVPTRYIRDAWDPDTCPIVLLPYLAQAWSVDEWDPEWTEAQKRQVIRDSVWIHKHKGTVGALRRALAQINFGATFKEWFEYAGRPYTFRIYVTGARGAEWTLQQATQLWRVALLNKNVRSYIDRIVVTQPTPTPTVLSLAIAVRARVHIRLLVEPVHAISVPRTNVYVGTAVVARQRWRITPR